MKEPIVTSTTNFIATGARKKGDPMDADTYAKAKKLLQRGLSKDAVCEQTVISKGTLRLITVTSSFAEYLELRRVRSNWHKGQNWKAPTTKPTKKPSFWARLFKK